MVARDGTGGLSRILTTPRVDRRTVEDEGPLTIAGGSCRVGKSLRVVWRALDFRLGFLVLGRFEVAIAHG